MNSFTALVELDRAASPEGVRLWSTAAGSDEYVGSVEIDTRTGELILGGPETDGPVAAACDVDGAPVLEVQIRSLVDRSVDIVVTSEGGPINRLGPFAVDAGSTMVAIPFLTELLIDPDSGAGTTRLRITGESPPAEHIVSIDTDGLAATLSDDCRPV